MTFSAPHYSIWDCCLIAQWLITGTSHSSHYWNNTYVVLTCSYTAYKI